MKFNINNEIKIKLTAYGKNILKEQHEELYKFIPEKRKFELPPEDSDGWSVWQMHDVMNRFGQYVWMGNNGLPFETGIEIIE